MGKHKIKIPISKEEYDEFLKVKNEFSDMLDNMSEEERKRWFAKLFFRKPINFEKEIDGTVYCVNTHFNCQAKTSVYDRIDRLIEQMGK